MNNFTINVQINVGVTPELNGLLAALIGKTAPTATATVAAPAEQAEKKTRAKKTDAPVEQQPKPEEKPEPQPEPAPAPAEETAAAPKEYTEVDVREAMDRTRKRIEGENYKEQTDSELYQKWHRPLTAWFKNTAALFGAEKPSTLPDSASRAAFIAQCDGVQVKDGVLVNECPF